MSALLFTAKEIGEAVGVSQATTWRRATKESWPSQEEQWRGGKRKHYPFESLPKDIQDALHLYYPERFGPTEIDMEVEQAGGFEYDRESLWEAYDCKHVEAREKAFARYEAILSGVCLHERSGVPLGKALALAAKDKGLNPGTLKNWYYGADGRPGVRLYRRDDWLAACVDNQVGRTARAEVPDEVWEHFKGLYLHHTAPSLSVCYRRTEQFAKENGYLAIPSMKTFERRVKTDISRRVLLLARKGRDAYDTLYPPMFRDHASFYAMEAVNGDGVNWRRYVIWPNGTVTQPCTWVWQDLYSGKILAWRTDVSENKDMLRLAFGDLLESYGIPKHAYLDNTRAAANKWMTGGTPMRNRFKITDEDPIGIMPSLAVEVHFTTPYRGQSKPIERAFRDLRGLVDSHPQWNGRGTKARPLPLKEFEEVLAREIATHNMQYGRRSAVCRGRSFDQVFEESYQKHAASIPRPTGPQRRMWLLTAEKVRADRNSGEVRLGKGPHGPNRYWSEELIEYASRPMVVRFDPQNMHKPVYVYTLDGRYVCEAPCCWRAGFNDSEAAREYHRAKKAMLKADREQLNAIRRLSAAEAAAMIPPVEPAAPPKSKVVRMASQPKEEEDGARQERLAVGADNLILDALEQWKKDQEM
jgi:hypothetical protein